MSAEACGAAPVLTRGEVRAVCQAQLARDLGCEAEALDSTQSVVMEWRDLPGRRKYSADPPLLEVVLWNGRCFAACGAALLPWARSYFPRQNAEWLFTPRHLREMEAALSPLGYEIGDAHHFYLPALPCAPAASLGPVRWYEAGELEQFREDPRWNEALAFGEYTPDILAVAALDGAGQPLGMAACSRDGERLWQIGINVQPEARGQGLGASLTALLKDEVLRRGAVPFYGTAESHIFSQNVALNAGFSPAFAYLYAKPKGN